MKKETEWLQTNDGEQIYLVQWTNASKPPKAIVQIAHGMAEHIERYDSFAQFLVNNHIHVYGNDHRGHGKTGERQGTMGYFSSEKGFEAVTEDLFKIINKINDNYPNTPLILFGHSMGSFIVRRYIQKYGDFIDGVILSGTGYYPRSIIKVGQLIAQREIRKRGPKEPSALINKLSFGSFNKKFDRPETLFDWLSRDKEQVKLYVNDPYTGFIPTGGFFRDLFDGLQRIHDKSNIKYTPKSLPFLFVSGDRDPVGSNTIGVKKVINMYQNNGVDLIDYIFYKDGRHEILNEINRQEVYQDILNWINNKFD